MKKLFGGRPTPALVISVIALCLAVGGATAIALPGKNTVDSGDIKNGQVKRPDIRGNAVNGAKIAPDSVSGADVNESSLGTVPSAGNANTLAGQGPAAYQGAASSNYDSLCDPSTATLIDCVSTTLALPRAGQVVLVAGGGQQSFGGPASGVCRFSVDGVESATPEINPGESATDNTSSVQQNGLSLTMATGVLPAGSHTFALVCSQVNGDQEIHDSSISAQLVG